jgi:hypothetical protein
MHKKALHQQSCTLATSPLTMLYRRSSFQWAIPAGDERKRNQKRWGKERGVAVLPSFSPPFFFLVLHASNIFPPESNHNLVQRLNDAERNKNSTTHVLASCVTKNGIPPLPNCTRLTLPNLYSASSPEMRCTVKRPLVS